MAQRQVTASARFYREGFARGAGEGKPDLELKMESSGRTAAAALDEFAVFLEARASRARGSGRLGAAYGKKFELVTVITDPVDRVLAAAQRDLDLKVEETAAYGRSVWDGIFPDQDLPSV